MQEQTSQAQEIEQHRQQTADAQASLAKRLELCSQLQDNLHARVGAPCFVVGFTETCQQGCLGAVLWCLLCMSDQSPMVHVHVNGA